MASKSAYNYRSGNFATEEMMIQGYINTLPLNLRAPVKDPSENLPEATNALYSGMSKASNASAAIRSVRSNSPTRDLSAYSPSIASATLDFALNDFKKAYPFLVKELFDRNRKPQDRLQAHEQICKLLDSTYNALRKYAEVTKLNFDDEIKAFEKYRSDFRSVVIQEFEQSFTEDYFAKILLNEISGINDERALSQDDFEDLADMTMLGSDLLDGPANNRTQNCTRTSLTTMAAMFGSKSQAPGGYDDVELDKHLRIVHHDAFAEMALVPWQNAESFDIMFGILKGSPENSFNFLRYGYKDQKLGHITVAANINGRPCIIEGQNNSVIFQNDDGSYTRAQSKVINGKSTLEYRDYDPSNIVHPIFLPIDRNEYATEFNRANAVMEKLYLRAHRLRVDEIRNDVELIAPKWIDDDPGDHLQQNPVIVEPAPIQPVPVNPKIRGLFD